MITKALIISHSNNFACSQNLFKVLLLNMQHRIEVKTSCIFADPLDEMCALF